jgi:uncharacterized lipoprotein YajG
MRFRAGFITCLSFLVLLGGCATNRGVLNITVRPSTETVQPTGKEVFINSVVDKRVFEEKPRYPSTPSLNPGKEINEGIKLRAIGRKRNSWGKAMGDLVLKEKQTVETLIASCIKQAFIEKGYKVLDSREQVTNKTYVVDAQIDKFWSWMVPIGVAITLNTEASTALTIKSQGGSETKNISVKRSNSYQTARGGNWKETIDETVQAYVDELKSRLE